MGYFQMVMYHVWLNFQRTGISYAAFMSLCRTEMFMPNVQVGQPGDGPCTMGQDDDRMSYDPAAGAPTA